MRMRGCFSLVFGLACFFQLSTSAVEAAPASGILSTVLPLMPDDVEFIALVDMAGCKSANIFPTWIAMPFNTGMPKSVLEKCKVDAFTAIRLAVMAGDAAGNGAVYLQVNPDFTQENINTGIMKSLYERDGRSWSMNKEGNLVSFFTGSGKTTEAAKTTPASPVYTIAWIGNILMVPTDPSKKPLALRYTGSTRGTLLQKIQKQDLLGRISLDAPFIGIFNRLRNYPQPPATVDDGEGATPFCMFLPSPRKAPHMGIMSFAGSGRNMLGNACHIYSSDSLATAAATELRSRMAATAGQIPPLMAGCYNPSKVVNTGTTVTVSSSIGVADIISVLTAMENEK